MDVKELENKITNKVLKEYNNKGYMGTESIVVKFELNEEEKQLVYGVELPDNYYLEIEGKTLYVGYSEEI